MCNLGEGIAEKNKALGKAIGKAEGMVIGKAEGVLEGTLKTLANMIKKKRITTEEAAEEANMSIADFEKAIATL